MVVPVPEILLLGPQDSFLISLCSQHTCAYWSS